MPTKNTPKSAPKPGPGLKDHEAPSVLEIHRQNIEFEDEHKRLVNGDISRNVFATQPFRKIEHIPCTDPQIEAFEERPILVGAGKPVHHPISHEKEMGVMVADVPCPECHSVNLIHGDGCIHCVPVLVPGEEHGDSKEFDPSVLIHAKHPDHFIVRGANRDKVIDKIPVGVGGHTKQTSPHIAGKTHEAAGKIIKPKVGWNHEKESRGRGKKNRLLRKTKVLIHKMKKKL